MKRINTLYLLGIAAVALAPSVHARGSLDPRVTRALETGIFGPVRFPAAQVSRGRALRRVPVIIRATRRVDEVMLRTLETRGGEVMRVDGKRLVYGSFVFATLDARSLKRVRPISWVERIALPPIPTGLRPLDMSAKLMRLQQGRGSHPAKGRLTGRGVTILDLDANVDSFHPQFFRGDGGYFDWIDSNADGVFTPNIDGIDLNQDGVQEADEVGSPLIAQTLDTFYGNVVPARSPSFDPAVDWVYFDQNHNGARDYGLDAGFDEGTPAWGEPIFVPDDVNRNGKIDVGERFIRLKTTKFKAIYVHLEHYAKVDHVFKRGVDMIAHESEYTGGAFGYPDALHGSGVMSILAADVPLVGRRWVGMAPDADLLLGFEVAQVSAKSVAWGLSYHPDVVLHETAGWTGDPMDGSDIYSQMVDESVVDDHVTHTCPTGNLGGSRKHAHLVLSATKRNEVVFHNPFEDLRYAQVSLNVRGGTISNVSLVEPDGTSHDAKDGGFLLSTGVSVYLTKMTTDRGTDFWDMLMYSFDSSEKIPSGKWSISMDAEGSAPTLDAYLMDEQSGWGEGVAWPASVATDDSTAGIPAISDHCIAVGAHVGHPVTVAEPWFRGDEEAGELRSYSSRGPRIDGVQKPDLAAPDNPWTAAPAGKTVGGNEVPHGAVWPFGGTSAAGPHVTGAASLLAQVDVRGDDARALLRSSSQVDSLVGDVPDSGFGWGRLDIATALGMSSTKGQPLDVSVKVEGPAYAGRDVMLRVVVDSGASAAEEPLVRWDDGYDGHWETDYEPTLTRTVRHEQPGVYPYKVRALDKYGWAGAAVVRLVVEQAPVVDAGVDAPAEAAGDGSTDGASADDSSIRGQELIPGGGGGCGCEVTGKSCRTHHARGLLFMVAFGAWIRKRRLGRMSRLEN